MIDESTDTTQLTVFVSGANGDFYVVENFVQLLFMMNTTTGPDIIKALLQCLEAMNLNLSKLVSTTTDRSLENYKCRIFTSKIRGRL